MPLMIDGMSKKQKRVVDTATLFQAIRNMKTTGVVIERVRAMPQNGAVSMFSFGMAFGQALAVATIATKGGVVEVLPRTWKDHHDLLKTEKQDSIDRAKELFGESYRWQFKADDGIAEAALMALWYLDTRPEIV
tara:strand:+ start:831 stop:1232 length:402 start_codon:yes stop_codon:yes gene_type:complete